LTRRNLSLAANLVALILALWAFWWEPSSLVVRSYRLEIPNWPNSVAGLRVAVLADLHIGSPYRGLDSLAQTVARTNAEKPDLIVMPGDFIGATFLRHHVSPEEFAPVLSGLRARLGVWAVLGNHDWWDLPDDVRRELESHGIGVLENRAEPLGEFWLAGIGDFWESQHDVPTALENVSEGAPLLAFTHNPDVFVDTPRKINLLVAGHTHGGQVWFPLLGRMVVPSRYGERFAIGHIVEDGRHLFVSPGIGTSIIPVRFLTSPEVSILEIHSVRGSS